MRESLAPGFELTPSVRLVRKLGRGGMGTVWIAEHAALCTEVVVKFMDRALAADPESVARFRREAAAAASVRSPHVVQIFDHDVTPTDVPYTVMELLEGRNLAEYLDDVGPMPLRDVARLVTQVAKALASAHELGIVHRDIKPDNIFLCDVGDDDLFIKLLDFGIAKQQDQVLDAETRTGVTLGTPFYMSPEQIVSARRADTRSDLWSLAVVAFESLTGHRPFEGETVGAIAVALHAERRPRPSTHISDVPEALDEFFARAFDSDREARFADAMSMCEAFRRAAAMEPTPRSAQRVTSLDAVVAQSQSSVSELLPLEVRSVDGAPARPRRVGARVLSAALGAIVVAIVAVRITMGAREPAAPSPANAVVANATVSEAATDEAPVAPAPLAPSIAPSVSGPTHKPAKQRPNPAASVVVKKKYVDIK